MDEDKLKNFNELEMIVSDLWADGKIIVWTNGCFDILHEGHIDYLKEAKKLGDTLIIGLNSDSSIRKIKGYGRPVNSEDKRINALSSLKFVDYLTVFSEENVIRPLKLLMPDVYVKGGDYRIDTINQDERKIVESYGARVSIIPLRIDLSTTKIIESAENV